MVTVAAKSNSEPNQITYFRFRCNLIKSRKIIVARLYGFLFSQFPSDCIFNEQSSTLALYQSIHTARATNIAKLCKPMTSVEKNRGQIDVLELMETRVEREQRWKKKKKHNTEKSRYSKHDSTNVISTRARATLISPAIKDYSIHPKQSQPHFFSWLHVTFARASCPHCNQWTTLDIYGRFQISADPDNTIMHLRHTHTVRARACSQPRRR